MLWYLLQLTSVAGTGNLWDAPAAAPTDAPDGDLWPALEDDES